MKAKDLLSILISIEDELVVEYEKFCMGDITQKTYEKRSEKIMQKQVNLINELEKDVLTDFLDFLLKNGYCDTDVYSEPPTAIDQYLIFDK